MVRENTRESDDGGIPNNRAQAYKFRHSQRSSHLALVPALLLAAVNARAHGAAELVSEPACTFDPWIVAPILVLGVTYLAGVWRVRLRTVGGKPLLYRRALLYGAGWLAAVAALVSPLHWLGERMFTFHMIEHEILMAVCAPLLVLARPLGTLLWALPHSSRLVLAGALRSRPMKATWLLLSGGTVATALHGAALWLWHVPALLDQTLTDVPLHRVQHLMFILTAFLFWWSVLVTSPRGVAMWHLFLTMLHMSILGALIALAPRVMYPAQTEHAYLWGLTALEDQQLAGIVMWIPAGTVYAGAAIALMVVWLRSGEPRKAYEVRDA